MGTKVPGTFWEQMPSCGIQYVEHTEGDGVEMFKAVCKLGFEGIVSKKVDAPYKPEPSKAWLKIKNPNAPAGDVAK
jgi:ATP-dependent DNA ligase